MLLQVSVSQYGGNLVVCLFICLLLDQETEGQTALYLAHFLPSLHIVFPQIPQCYILNSGTHL